MIEKLIDQYQFGKARTEVLLRAEKKVQDISSCKFRNNFEFSIFLDWQLRKMKRIKNDFPEFTGQKSGKYQVALLY